MLAKYVTCLEARHPNTIEEMTPSVDDLDHIVDNMPEGLSKESREEMRAFLKKLHMGKVALGAYVSIDNTLANSVLCNHSLEFRFSSRQLVTSDYPVGRIGRYDRGFLLSIAVAPDHAIMWLPSSDMHTAFGNYPKISQAKLINFLTIGDAKEAFSSVNTPDSFVSKNLGWKKNLDFNEQVQQLSELIFSLDRG